MAEINITPLRGVLTPTSSHLKFVVSNPSQHLVSAKVSLIDLRATPTGYTKSDFNHRSEISAAPWLIVSPVSFSLDPGSRQEVLVMLNAGKPLPQTEKRSHLYVETGPSRAKIHQISMVQPGSNQGTGLGLDARLGISLPIILRGADLSTNTKAHFKNTQLVRDKNDIIKLETVLSARNLPHSLTGSISLLYTPNNQEHDKVEMAQTKNIALYTDSLARNISISLNEKALDAGTLTLTYEGTDEYYGRTLAQKIFEVGN